MSVTVNTSISGTGAATSGIGSETHLGTITAATMLATPSPLTGWTCRVSDLGNTSPWFEYDGSAWVPLGRRQLAFRLIADTASISLTTSAQAFAGCSCLFPAGVLDFTGAGIRVLAGIEKSAATDTATYSLRFGANNSSADTVLADPSTTDRGAVLDPGYRRTSATAFDVIGKGATASFNRLSGGTTNSARASDITVSTLAGATYLGLYASAAGTPTETAVAYVFDVYVTG